MRTGLSILGYCRDLMRQLYTFCFYSCTPDLYVTLTLLLPSGNNEMLNSRRFALGIELGRTEPFFDDESRDFLRFVLLHGLQESLIALTPVLTLRGQIQRGHHCKLPQHSLIQHTNSRWRRCWNKCSANAPTNADIKRTSKENEIPEKKAKPSFPFLRLVE